jgi:hypothetical protein
MGRTREGGSADIQAMSSPSAAVQFLPQIASMQAIDPWTGMQFAPIAVDPYGALPVAAAAPTMWIPQISPTVDWSAPMGGSMLDALADALVPESLVAPQVTVAPLAAPAPAPTAVAATYAANTAPTTESPRKQDGEVWAGGKNPNSVHVSQVRSKFNTNAASGNRDCGPASVVVALRMLGLSVPGAKGGDAQQAINRVRELGNAGSNGSSTTNFQLERALTAAGASVSEISSIDEVKAAVTSGKPVVLNGNPANPGAYGKRFAGGKMIPYNGAHWIAVTGYDHASGKFIINDPLSKAGAVKVSRSELAAYLGGSIGIVVDKA